MDALTPPNRRPSEEQTAASRRDNARKWRWWTKQRGNKPKRFNRASLRVRDIQIWFRFYYGCGLPEDDDGALEDIEVLINYAAICGKPPWQPLFDVWTPWLDDAERERIVESAIGFPIWHDDDELARKLGIRYAQRQALGITGFSSVDVDLEGCKRLRRERDKESKKQQRAAVAALKVQSLTARQSAILEAVADEAAVPDLVDQLKRHKAFRGLSTASVKTIVHRDVDRPCEKGLITTFKLPGLRSYARRRHE